jgi:hypothetical protein
MVDTLWTPTSANATTAHLFLWDASHGLHELLGQVDGWPQYELEDRIAAINEVGQIVIAARDPLTRQAHVLLLTPETL